MRKANEAVVIRQAFSFRWRPGVPRSKEAENKGHKKPHDSGPHVPALGSTRTTDKARAGREPQDREGVGLMIPRSVLLRADHIIECRS